MGCLSGIAKYLLFIFNFLIVVCGIVLIAFGAILLVNENKGISSFTEFSVGGFAVAVGVIIFLIAFFGCCGAIKENNCLLTTYAVILILLFILQVTLGALAFIAINRDDWDEKIVKATREVFDAYFKDKQNASKKEVVDNIQKYFECCGVKGPQDYFLNGILFPPNSCFRDEKPSEGNLYTTGCSDLFKDAVTKSIKVIGGVALGFAIIELLGAVFAYVVKSRK